MKLEVVRLPVSDVDRAMEFYEKSGWRLDANFVISDDFRIGNARLLQEVTERLPGR